MGNIDLDKINLPQDPIFIVGCPRSGTTLLQSLLATQENLYSLPETHFFNIIFSYIETDEDGYIKNSCLNEMFKKIKIWMDLEFSPSVADKITLMAEEKKLKVKKLFEVVVSHYMDEQINDYELTKFRWIEKTPSHFYVLERILTLYPAAHFISIIRHPIPVIHSRKKNIPKEKELPVAILAQEWNRMIFLIENFKEKYPNRLYLLKYEDLVEKTDVEMRALCNFLSVEIKLNRLKRYKDVSRKFIRPWEHWKNDVKSKEIINTNDLHKKEMAVIDVLRIQRITKKNMKKYGYGISFPTIQKVYNLSVLLRSRKQIMRHFENFEKSILLRISDLKKLELLSQILTGLSGSKIPPFGHSGRANLHLLSLTNHVNDQIRRLNAKTMLIPDNFSFYGERKLEVYVLKGQTPWSSVILEESQIPGMMSREERQYYSYIGQFYSGKGEVIELGPWLGCSTFYILQGLTNNPNFSDKKLHVYDDFVWRASWMNRKVDKAEQLDDYQDFRFLFDKYTATFKDGMIVEKRRIGPCSFNESIPPIVWSGRPIEIIYVDCGRTYQANETWYKIFHRSFIPNTTLIIMQDWRTHREIPVKKYNQTKQFTDSKGSKLQLIHELEKGSIATFLYRGSDR